jgi:hypothetical protein
METREGGVWRQEREEETREGGVWRHEREEEREGRRRSARDA